MRIITSTKSLVAVLLLILIANFSNAQQWQWAKAGGGSNSDVGRQICTDGTGFVYVAGIFDSPSITFSASTLTNNNAGTNDVYLVKYNSTGILIWARTLGGLGIESVEGLCTDNSGNVYITGNFASTSISIGTVTIFSGGGANDLYIALCHFLCLMTKYTFLLHKMKRQLFLRSSPLLLFPNKWFVLSHSIN